MSSKSISRLAQLRAHLVAGHTSGGGATEANPLILYDLKSGLKDGMAWSPNVWKTRLLLNYKKIPYRTVWLAYPDVESELRRLGFQPTSVSRTTGKSYWSVPAIVDPSKSGEANLVTDSPVIAKYLEVTYPGHTVFPEGTHAFQNMFIKWSSQNIMPPLVPLLVPPQRDILDEGCKEYYTKTRQVWFGKPLEEVCRGKERELEVAKLKNAMTLLDGFLASNEDGDFLMGRTRSYADFILGAYFIWMQKVPAGDRDPEHETLWEIVKHWHDGRWERIMNAFTDCLEQK